MVLDISPKNKLRYIEGYSLVPTLESANFKL